jgi:molybdopterin molybdotransferase
LSSLYSVNEARAQLISELKPVGRMQIELYHAYGMVLSEDIISPIDLPPFPNSQMDGYAVKFLDVASASPENPVALRVVADIPAGIYPQISLQKGEAARIMTGAVIPEGTDLVIPIEETDQQDRTETRLSTSQISVFKAGRAGQFLRLRGQDIRAGQKVLSAGQRLKAQDVGLLAMLGIAKVPVFRRPRIALLSTGDEILPIDQPLTPGKVHDANFFVLAALLKKTGAEVVNLGIAVDTELSVKQCLDRAITEKVDIIISTAGVSVGVFDYVRKVIAENGSIEFWQVNIRPGKPIAFGYFKDVPFIGLPGNPVSAFVGFEVFARPAILKLSGNNQIERISFQARTAESIESDGRESYLRSKIVNENGEWVARLTESHQGSGNLWSLVQANALLIVPAGVKSLPAGSKVEVWMLIE